MGEGAFEFWILDFEWKMKRQLGWESLKVEGRKKEKA